MNKRIILSVFCILLLSVIQSQCVIAEINWTEHVIELTTGVTDFQSVHANDLDGDGDTDLLAIEEYTEKAVWWENNGNQYFIKRCLHSNFINPEAIFAADVNTDGKMDVITAARDTSRAVSFWENTGSSYFVENIIWKGIGAYGAIEVYASDIDSDGDIDILVGGGTGFYNIYWWENIDNLTFTQHAISGHSYDDAYSLFAKDVNGDSYVDVLVATNVEDDIYWLRNDGNQNFDDIPIDGSFDWARSVYAVDLDSDDDIDVLGAARNADQIAWWINDGFENFQKDTLASGFDGAYDVNVADFDMDGHIDVVGVAYDGGDISWFENDGDENFTQYLIDGDFDLVNSVYVADIDGDGDMDIITGGRYEITWWENDAIVYDCDVAVSDEWVPNDGGYLIWEISVTNNSDQATPVWCEMRPRAGDCENGTPFPGYFQIMQLTSNLGAGETFTGNYYLPISGVTGIDTASVEFAVGSTNGNWNGYDCFDFVFAYPYGGFFDEPNLGDWGEWLSEGEEPNTPIATSLYNNYPNPFNATTNISFNLSQDGNTTLKVYNLVGQEVESLVDGYLQAGDHGVIWDASRFSSGLYFYKLTAGDNVFTKRMTLLK